MNKDQISQLWDVVTPRLYGYLVNTLRDKELAHDILQNAWLKAIENISQFKGNEKEFSSWLFMIARNEMRQYWRKGGREVRFDPLLHDKETDASQENKEGEMFLDQVVARLSASDQELVRLRYIGDMSFSEIAKVLNINQVALRVRMHRALGTLRTQLKAQSL